MILSLRGLGCIVLGCATWLAVSCASKDDAPTSSSGTGGSSGSGGSGGHGAVGNATMCTDGPSGYSCKCAKGSPEQCCAQTLSPDGAVGVTELPVMTKEKIGAQVAPDWSCIGIGTADAAGSAGAAGAGGDGGPPQRIFEVEDFGGSGLVSDTDVDIWEGNSISGTPFASGTTKGPQTPGDPALNNGQMFFPQPTTPTVSYKVKEKAGINKQFLGFGLDVDPPPKAISGATVSPATFNQLATFAVPLAGWTPPADLGIVTGRITDCAGDDVGGAVFEFVDESTGKVVPTGLGARDARFIFFDSEYPNPRCGYSDYRQALMIVINAPSNDGDPTKKYKIRFKGRLKDSDVTPVVFAERSVQIFANAVNVQYIKPNVAQ